jgi:Zn-dependent protease with chaperone function
MHSSSYAMGRRAVVAQMVALALIAIMAAPQLLAAVTPIRFPLPHSSAYTHEQQIQIGQQGDQEVRQKMPVLPDSDPLTQYVRYLGDRLAPYVPNSPNPRYPYTFHVVNMKEVNAFSLPGGPVYVNLGTIQAADNEAQLAGVIGHEMGHTYMQHAASQATKEGYAQVGLGILGAILGGGVAGALGRTAIALGANAYFLKYSRTDESEADHVGALLMYQAGYNPQALADFFRKLEQQGGSQGPQFLSDHPDPGNRAQAIAAIIRQLPQKQYTTGDMGHFQQVHDIAMGRRPVTQQQASQQGSNGQNGGMRPVSQGDVMPSGSWQTLNHSAFRLQYPANWQIVSGNESSDVTIAPPAGVSQSAIAYGVIIREFEPESDAADAAMHELENDIRQSNPNLRVIGHDEAITVNGVRGRSVDMTGRSPIDDSSGRPARERDWLVMVPWQQGRDIYLVFVAPESDFDRLRPTFEQMLRSFQLAQE